MKKTLLLLLFLLSILKSNGQNYNPLLSDSCKWYKSQCYEGCWTYISFTDGDTLIHDTLYFKYFVGEKYIFQLGYIREDTLNKKVYFKGLNSGFESDTSEFIFYDFSLVKGDSISIKIPEAFCYDCNEFNKKGEILKLGWFIVDSTSLISTIMGERNIIYLSRIDKKCCKPYYYINWIEGIGFAYVPDIGDIYQDPLWLNCFYRRDIQEYSGYEWGPNLEINEECNYTVSKIENYNNKKDDILITIPNSESINILILDPVYSEKNIINIYDVSGHLIKQENITNNNEINVNISDLKKGIYFISVIYDNKCFVRKILI